MAALASQAMFDFQTPQGPLGPANMEAVWSWLSPLRGAPAGRTGGRPVHGGLHHGAKPETVQYGPTDNPFENQFMTSASATARGAPCWRTSPAARRCAPKPVSSTLAPSATTPCLALWAV